MNFYEDYIVLIPDEEKRKEAYEAFVKNNLELMNDSYKRGKEWVKDLKWFRRLFKKF